MFKRVFKRMVSIVAVMVLLLPLSMHTVLAAETETIALSSGFTNVSFANDYYGFCIDNTLSGAYEDDVFTYGKASDITNNGDGANISQALKILFTQCFEDLFVSDGNGGYKIKDATSVSDIQAVIWNYTDKYYIWGEQQKLVNKVNAYTGNLIPDSGYQISLTNGDIITFHFLLLKSNKENQQDFFAYKLEVSTTGGHGHTYPSDWESDGENHWHECECGDKADVEKHEGTIADCVTASKCEECGKELSGVNPDVHTGKTVVKGQVEAEEFKKGYTGDIHCEDCDALLEKGREIPATHEHDYSEEWESDGENHWHECECGDKTDVENHEGNEADCVTPSVCEKCEKELSGADPEVHTGNTEIRNQVEPKEFEDGYTGDIHCKDCGELLEKGEKIPATHEHDYSDDWESDGENHWHECECGDKTDVENHEGNEADCVTPSVCEKCEKELSGADPEVHTGNTEIRNQVEPKEFEDGYTGDIHCKDCGELLEKGEKIPATHEHDYSEDWKSDGENHWHECECGDKKDVENHEGNEADCVTPSVCEKCEKELSGADTEVHTGNTEIRNQVEPKEFEDGYTGDIHCKDCGELLEKGEKIPATHKHNYSDGVCTGCGDGNDRVPQTGDNGYGVWGLLMVLSMACAMIISKKYYVMSNK